VRSPRPEQFRPVSDKPTTADLAAIEHEWPLIEAEMALVDAEIRLLTSDRGPTPLDWRRLRRAETQVLRAAAALLASSGSAPGAVAA
jgi:hypothetical protein